MAYVAPVPRGGKPPTRVTWTYDDGSKLGPDTDQAAARLFQRMTENLTVDELRLLSTIIKRRTAELTEAAAAASRLATIRAQTQNRLTALAADMPYVVPP